MVSQHSRISFSNIDAINVDKRRRTRKMLSAGDTIVTLDEAATLIGMTREEAKREFAEIGGAKGSPKFLGLASVACLCVMARLRDVVADAMKSKIVARIRDAIARGDDVIDASDIVVIKIGDAVSEISKKTERYVEWKAKLASDPDRMSGAAMLPNAGISVAKIAWLSAKGMTHETIAKTYPGVTDDDVAFSRVFFGNLSGIDCSRDDGRVELESEE